MSRRVCYTLFAIVMLAACGDGQRRRLQLEELERMNRADSVMTNDSLARDLADYFDRHGTANEQLRAYYILGRTYADIGETPHAVDCYLDAIAKADTTAADCDYHTIGCAYSQMADMFHRQLLLTNEIAARKQSLYFAEMAGETLNAISSRKLSAGAYILLNKRDTAEAILQEVLRLYKENGNEQDAIQASTMLMFLYLDRPEKLTDLKLLINQYDETSNLFDEHHELPPHFRQFYYYKGKYNEEINRLDSAEYYYRKVFRPDMRHVDKNPMYKGLLSVFNRIGAIDSITKYANLYSETNDSSVIINSQQLTAQLSSSYNYNRYQKEAKANEQKASRIRIILIGLVSIFIIIAIMSLWQWDHYRQRQKTKMLQLQQEQQQKQLELEQLQAAYTNATDSYEQNLHELQLLEDSHRQVIQFIQEELDATQNENTDFKARYAEAKRNMTLQNEEFELKKEELTKENAILLQKIEEMKRQGGLSKQLEKTKQFSKTSIARRVNDKALSSRFIMQETEWEELLDTAKEYYPELIYDLNHAKGTTPQKVKACVLYILHLRTSDVANFLCVKPERATNLKGDLNMALFNDSSARTLFKNLAQRYDIYIG